MGVDSLALTDFRNYSHAETVFHPDCNILVGENAQGKTNLLEAIACLSGVKPPRVRADRDLIQFSADAAALSADVSARQRVFRVQIRLSRAGRRKMSVNGVPAKSSADLRNVFHTVFFRPEDLQLIRDGAAVRRRFLDAALCQILPRYAAALAAYHDAWTQKSRILRDAEQFPALLPALPDFSEQMIRHGAALIRCRARYLVRLQEYAAERHSECSRQRETLSVRYRTVSTVADPAGPVADIAAALRAHMEAHERAERASKQCLSGPHRDDFDVEINGRDARQWSSQGQTRTAALALKLAEREILRDASGEYPVLLLDDVLSELDPFRQSYALERVRGGQLFLTCCEEDRLSDALRGQIFRVRDGTLSPA